MKTTLDRVFAQGIDWLARNNSGRRDLTAAVHLLGELCDTTDEWIVQAVSRRQQQLLDEENAENYEAAMDFKFQPGQQVIAQNSGKSYRIIKQRDYNGEPRYDVVGWRNGKSYGPVRIVRESAFVPFGHQQDDGDPR